MLLPPGKQFEWELGADGGWDGGWDGGRGGEQPLGDQTHHFWREGGEWVGRGYARQSQGVSSLYLVRRKREGHSRLSNLCTTRLVDSE